MIRILRRLTATVARLIEGAYKLRGILRKKGFIREFRREIEAKATGAYLESLHGFQDRRPPCQAATLPPCWANGKGIESESCSGLPLADRDRCPHRKRRLGGFGRLVPTENSLRVAPQGLTRFSAEICRLASGAIGAAGSCPRLEKPSPQASHDAQLSRLAFVGPRCLAPGRASPPPETTGFPLPLSHGASYNRKSWMTR